MNQSMKLQPIAKINKQQERHAGRVHGETLRQAELQKKQLQDLVNYRNHYEKAFKAATETGLSVVKMQEFQLFISRLDDAIKQQNQQVDNSQNQCNLSQKEWMKKRSKRQMVDKVIENRQQAELQAIEKQEQTELENMPHKTFTNI